MTQLNYVTDMFRGTFDLKNGEKIVLRIVQGHVTTYSFWSIILEWYSLYLLPHSGSLFAFEFYLKYCGGCLGVD